ncbi:M48 family metalloprotease [Frankia sp. CNm7]|uniref:M48 family metalloprotease n=1 Tax=Frankia nepalensis TaxID=1836974 RepID=A0A937RC00_9ACTN|nr:M48 family metalloprotease [Frankia nepalensis]MBL7498026.1 M48 family metalloprotease [Frankia nepalensis]MBL7515402.1 M48 family metalloprotease [Frankia nepalensis]MBL7523091.1 M48 family metalloprotease [Frankia nepalensis]MBL7629328.1 M48 family metalloprotease [Frankia nepalensis]
MLDHFVVSVVVAPLLVLIGTSLLADRVRPEVAAPVIAWSALVVASASFVNLVLFGLQAVAEFPRVAALGGWSSEMVRAGTEPVAWVPEAALAWVVAATLAVAYGCRRHRRALGAAWSTVDGLGLGGLGGGGGDGGDGRDGGRDSDVVVVDDERVEAFALPGRPGAAGRVVITSGLRETVDSRLYEAVVAHERAHLARRHHRLVWRVRLAGLLQPILWPVISRVDYLVERAADEAAARSVGDRDDVARALAHTALASLGPGRASGRRMGPLAMNSSPGVVPRRIAAIMSPAQTRRWLLAVPLLLAAGTVVWTFECAYDLHELVALARGAGG